MDSVSKLKKWVALSLAIFLGLLILTVLFVAFVPIEDCPDLRRIDCEGASRQPGNPQDPVEVQWKTRRAEHFVSKRCALCGGTGRVALLKKWTVPWFPKTPLGLPSIAARGSATVEVARRSSRSHSPTYSQGVIQRSQLQLEGGGRKPHLGEDPEPEADTQNLGQPVKGPARLDHLDRHGLKPSRRCSSSGTGLVIAPDKDPRSLRVIDPEKETDLIVRENETNLIQAVRTRDGRLTVTITTYSMGHAGVYGLFYSSGPPAPGEVEHAFGIDGRIAPVAPHWWRVSDYSQ
jgi:hypothetical protein